MTGCPDPRAAADRIEQLLEGLRGTSDPRTFGRVEEVLRLVTDLYGAGLARVEAITRAYAPGLLEVLAADDLVASLLILHDLHPVSTATRLGAALDRVGPVLAAQGAAVELVALDTAAGTVRLRLVATGTEGRSTPGALRAAVEEAVLAAAPELVAVEVVPGGCDRPVSDELDGVAGAAVPVALGVGPWRAPARAGERAR